jgi:hypothetical protein
MSANGCGAVVDGDPGPSLATLAPSSRIGSPDGLAPAFARTAPREKSAVGEAGQQSRAEQGGLPPPDGPTTTSGRPSVWRSSSRPQSPDVRSGEHPAVRPVCIRSTYHHAPTLGERINNGSKLEGHTAEVVTSTSAKFS